MLKLKRVKIENFRQFRDVELEFGDSKGIFLFLGQNGIGKSNFLNAICWCLYSEQPFQHDQEGMGFLNEEAKKDGEEEVSVVVEIEEDGRTFRFERKGSDGKRNEFTAMLQDGGDWDKISNPNTIVGSNFLPESIRSFFIFDGEHIQNLFRGDYAKNLKEGVWKVSHVSILDRAGDHLQKVIQELRRKSAKGDSSLEEIEGELSMTEEEIKEVSDGLNDKSDNLTKLTENIQQLRKKQSRNEKYRDRQNRREKLEDHHEELKKDIHELREQIDEKLINFSKFAYLKDPLKDFLQKIQEGSEKGEIPPKIRTTFISDLIEKEECICGTDLNEGSDELKNLKDLLDEVTPYDQNSFLLEDRYAIENMLSEMGEFPSEVKELRKEKNKKNKRKERVEKELKEISEDLKNAPDPEVGDMEKTIEKYEKKKDECNREIAKLEDKNEKLKEKKKELENQFDKETEKKKKKEKIRKKLNLASIAKERVEKIRERIIKEVREEVSEKTTQHFKTLIWKKGEFEEVSFDNEYRVTVTRAEGETNLLSSLSTGEKKALGFATIKALAELSGFKEVPVFIDGPLEYLDPEVQENFLESLPEFMPNKQVFIFSVDRESVVSFGKDEVDPSNFYQFERQPDSISTTIKQYQ